MNHNENDGTFWMALPDFISNFASLSIVRIFENWHTISIKSEWTENLSGGCMNNKETYFQNP